jgi:hypothetical protein
MQWISILVSGACCSEFDRAASGDFTFSYKTRSGGDWQGSRLDCTYGKGVLAHFCVCMTLVCWTNSYAHFTELLYLIHRYLTATGHRRIAEVRKVGEM